MNMRAKLGELHGQKTILTSHLLAGTEKSMFGTSKIIQNQNIVLKVKGQTSLVWLKCPSPTLFSLLVLIK